MLATHLIAASLASGGPAVLPPRQPDLAVAVTYAGEPLAPADPVPVSEPPAVDQPPAPDTSPAPATSNASEAPPAPSAYQPEVVDLPRASLDKDPLEGFNRVSWGFSQAVDKVLIRPLAMSYRTIIPKPLRDGAHNALENAHEPIVFLNDLLQLRPDRALRTLARFLINSTLGLGGLFDIARREPFHIAHHENGLADTLGYYGVHAGPYIYLPILGPTTLRDAVDNSESLVLPLTVGAPFDRTDYDLSTTIVDGLDQRERNDDDLKAMLSDAIDPYATFRADYLQDRQAEIEELKARAGEHAAVPSFDDPLADPAAKEQAAPAGQ
jgi:phospholipid-binding lipoprotein MlaA